MITQPSIKIDQLKKVVVLKNVERLETIHTGRIESNPSFLSYIILLWKSPNEVIDPAVMDLNKGPLFCSTDRHSIALHYMLQSNQNFIATATGRECQKNPAIIKKDWQYWSANLQMLGNIGRKIKWRRRRWRYNRRCL